MSEKKYFELLPKKFIQNVTDLCDDEGREWLENLPLTIKELEIKWEIAFEKHFENLSYNYVASCIGRNNTPTVLKIAMPFRNPEIFIEASALEMFDGFGAVKLLKIDKTHRAILIERLLPGKHLKEVFSDDKEKSVDIAIEVTKKISYKTTANKTFTPIEFWFNEMANAKQTKFPQSHLSKAFNLFDKLNSNTNNRLIHGDLHHENILSVGDNEFKAIDPKGNIGSIGYEIAVFLRNHTGWVDNKAMLQRAVEQFAEAFGLSVEEVKDWAHAQHILSVWWDFNDGGKHWQKELERVGIWEHI